MVSWVCLTVFIDCRTTSADLSGACFNFRLRRQHEDLTDTVCHLRALYLRHPAAEKTEENPPQIKRSRNNFILIAPVLFFPDSFSGQARTK
ncbi:hypothetical protein HG15A2_31750 [Adhaeretor mobilis]|uniref:Uncharacterized protein n=1 Tax=Adhaeretor mobilis TaxID=1930276 RepID=A0A517MY92_9BACT|nr:hypothetical protein HG15A2_31750 [Adhaeretor mobilis]